MKNLNDILELDKLDIQDLFTYRFIFDDPKDLVDLEMDINDLSLYPDRINGSYKDEWCHYIKGSINRILAQQSLEKTESNIIALIEQRRSRLKDKADLYEALHDKIVRAQAIKNEPKVTVLKTAVHQYLDRIINPNRWP